MPEVLPVSVSVLIALDGSLGLGFEGCSTGLIRCTFGR